MSNIITLTTDFGIIDPYAGIMKGAILSLNARCIIVDITHEIPTHDIMHGCITLSTACDHFPENTIHVAVVDPGVGTTRRCMIIETAEYIFVGPDNGIFSFILQNKNIDKTIIEITNSSMLPRQPSSTFHGRDIFAPVAAYLSNGTKPCCFGPELHDPVIITMPEPVTKTGNMAEGLVMHIDRFGNLVTNFSEKFIKNMFGNRIFRVEINNQCIAELHKNYAGASEREPFCIFGSTGMLEISMKDRSAKEWLNCKKGQGVRIEGC